MATQTIETPDLGNDQAAEVIEICVMAGDSVTEGDPLIVLESDKASMEIPSPLSGVIQELKVKIGDSIQKGNIIADIKVANQPPSTENKCIKDDAADDQIRSNSEFNSPAVPPSNDLCGPLSDKPMPIDANNSTTEIYAGPAVRKLARELGIDLKEIDSSGPRNRIIKKDIHTYVRKIISGNSIQNIAPNLLATPDIDFSKFGLIDVFSLSEKDKITASTHHQHWYSTPHVTQFNEVDISDLENFRHSLHKEATRRNIKLTLTPFILMATASAIKQNTKFTASLSSDNEKIIYKKFINIGVIVNTAGGLIVPVLREVDQKSIFKLAEELTQLTLKSQNQPLTQDDIDGSCFTIFNLGKYGGNGFTSIINFPEPAILGISQFNIKPMWNGQCFQPRTILPLCLSYNHKLINGAEAGKFLTDLSTTLADVRKLLL
ncbi:2-oxo acid dehydrogenase subunit E2 [Zhongshania marina]|uniref:Dihydrolipoamide acetyltransferase component of pyruvate dehydrogenase complex n=1 Tax=Zhongshania marina TaxID=2304603 RepID=A0A2S4HE65_9GAMM|nr:2-oxo acid dehydrogenase subunit E2 [Marortus luteolus]POP52282.1 dihydrolipoamide acetyltransferase [Marortus luteolus]